jgi:hypothetical protein
MSQQPIQGLPKINSGTHYSFTRDIYDPCEYKKYKQESEGPFKWLSQDVYEQQNECHVDQSPFMRNNESQGINRQNIDVESELLNMTRQLGRCPEMKYNPNDNVFVPKYKTDCKDSRLVPQYTRVDKPCNVFSGVSTLDLTLNPLCSDLQDYNRIHRNSYIGSNTRLMSRDTYAKQQNRKFGQ